MRRALAATLLLAVALSAGGASQAPLPDGTPQPRRSGFDDMSPALQTLQRDDTQNPAWLWLKDGEQRFAADCAGCHDESTLRDVATRYPAFDTQLARPLNLSGRINQCRVRHLKQPMLQPESDEMLALESWLGWLARDQPIRPPADPRMEPARAQGEQLYRTRFGQLDFSCAQCHDDNAGGRLSGSTVPQAHPTGYPIYRLEWQGMGSLQRRLRGCMSAVRAEPFAATSDEAIALEAFLARRAAGMPIETPAVRP